MKILAIDSSSRVRSVALCERGTDECGPVRVLAELSSPSERGGRFASLITDVLQKAGLERKAIDKIAIGVGPGSAAGIRSTLSFAIGWQIANGLTTCGVSSAWAVAAEAQSEGMTGGVSVILKGPIGRFIHASFSIEGSGIREASPLRMASIGDVESLALLSDRLIGPDVDTIFPSIRDGLGQGEARRERVTIFPTAKAVGSLVLNHTVPAICPLEPLVLSNPTFVKAPAPRVIPDVS